MFAGSSRLVVSQAAINEDELSNPLLPPRDGQFSDSIDGGDAVTDRNPPCPFDEDHAPWGGAR